MRILVLTAGLVALAGTAFAGEPQSSTNVQQPIVASAQKQIPAASLRAPQKMSDRQLEKIVAG